MNYQLQCECGTLRAEVSHANQAARGVCYCKDCRAYTHHLGKAAQVLDAQGGVGFVATQGPYVRFTQGLEQLACLSLSPKGPLRWYAKCCNTPICNTVRSWKFSYVGIIYTPIKANQASFEAAFPTIQMRINPESAHIAPPSMRWRTVLVLLGFMSRVLRTRISGAYRNTALFTGPDGRPIAEVQVLSKEERAKAQQMDRP